MEPSFFVVGAPRCGTTAICDFLGQHPELFIPTVKEPHYFGSDLNRRRGYNSLDEYKELFQEGVGQKCGEGSTWYLYSSAAAQEIYDFNLDAKIIISLRNPVDMVYSWHGFAVKTGIEDVADFSKALDMEDERRQTQDQHKGDRNQRLAYSQIPLYAQQVERYFKVFGRDNVHIIIHDNFRSDPNKTLIGLFEFLDVDPGFEAHQSTVNSHAEPRSLRLARTINRSPDQLRKVLRSVLPQQTRTRLRNLGNSLNSTKVKREDMAPETRERLRQLFEPEVTSLSTLLDRDLGHWK